jgi:hydroxymethylbilane synthase
LFLQSKKIIQAGQAKKGNVMKNFRLGTRESPLALAQTHIVIDSLEHHHPDLKGRFEIVPLKTTGDTLVDRSLTDVGGKSLFTKEIENALLEGIIDLAIHSMKDMATEMPQGLTVSSMLEREDPRDALITREGCLLENLPKGALFGTSSLRRQAFVLHKFPHLKTTSLRGNVGTRLKKVETGEIDATLLAVAGLKRLNFLINEDIDLATSSTVMLGPVPAKAGIVQHLKEIPKHPREGGDQDDTLGISNTFNLKAHILPLDDFIPAVGQGAIGIQCRETDQDLLEILSSINHLSTFQAVTAERSFMKALNGSCRTPLAAYASIEGDRLSLRGMKSDPQGKNMHFISREGSITEAEKIGREAALSLKKIPCPTSS